MGRGQILKNTYKDDDGVLHDRPYPVASRGLKNHEIAKLVNKVRDEINAAYGQYMQIPQSLRGVISGAVVQSLNEQNLLIDKESMGMKD